MTLSAVAFLEKNKLSSAHAWLVLVKMSIPNSGPVIRVVANTENVTWPVTAGEIYVAFPFSIDSVSEASQWEVPSISLRVSNVGRVLETYLDDYDGMIDSIVNIYIVNAIHVTTDSKGTGVNNYDAERELEFVVVNTDSDENWVTFNLGASNPFNKRFPRNKIYKNICRYREFKGARCQYVGAATSCDRTLATCKSYNNSLNFGGCPGVGTKGIYV